MGHFGIMREHVFQYIPGNNWVVCDVCGFDFRASEIKKRWDGLYVCKKDFEIDHPQKKLKVKMDRVSADIVRPNINNTESLLTNGPDTVGAGWTDNGDGSYTADGSQEAPTITWNNITTSGIDYSLIIYVVEHNTGAVKFGIDDSSIETDAISIPGMVQDSGTAASTDAVITASSFFNGTVKVSLGKKAATITQSDL